MGPTLRMKIEVLLLFACAICTSAFGWDHCAGSPPYNKSCYEYTTVGDKMAGLGTYYDLDCNTTNPGVGCDAYGHKLCRTCSLNGTDKGHGECPKIPCLYPPLKADAWDHCAGSPPYNKSCYEYTTVGDKMAGLGTYYDLDCNTTNPGVGCNAYGHKLCRSCSLNGTDKGHGECPKIPCLYPP